MLTNDRSRSRRLATCSTRSRAVARLVNTTPWRPTSSPRLKLRSRIRSTTGTYGSRPATPLRKWRSIFYRSLVRVFCSLSSTLLMVPLIATSTDAERAFSRGHLTVSRLRHSLSEESVRASTVLGSWANIPGLVPEAEIVELLKQNGRRPRATNAHAPTAGPSAAATAGTSGTSGASGSSSKKAAGSSKSAGKGKSSAIVID